METPLINWHLLAEAIAYYKGKGYQYVEAPWTVRRDITEVTFPNAYEAMGAGEKDSVEDLVGSAEQSFLQLALDEQLEKGRYVALTPCFRQEAEITATHRPYFMKVELFDSLTPTQSTLGDTVELCLKWFEKHTTGKLEIVKTPEGFDINLNGIEIGSYMLKSHNGLEWICATGHAEPRFSVASKV